MLFNLSPRRTARSSTKTNKTIHNHLALNVDQPRCAEDADKGCSPDILKKYKIPPVAAQIDSRSQVHAALGYRVLMRITAYAAGGMNIGQRKTSRCPRTQDDYLAMLRIPSSDGVPLEATRHSLGKPKNPTHTRVVTLSTSAITPIKVAAAELIPPTKGYRKVADEMDMFLSTEQDDDIEKVLSESRQAQVAQILTSRR